MPVQLIGTVGGESLTVELGDGRIEVGLAELARAHEGGLEGYFA